MFKHILVPTDFSEPSDAALAYARVLAETFGGSLHVLHVVEIPPAAVVPEVYIPKSPEFTGNLFDEAKSRLEHQVTAHDRTHFGATTTVVSGATARTIVAYAAKNETDLIVMGTHGRGGLSHLIMGSVAENVVRHAPCPVMTVRRAPSRADDMPEPLLREWTQTGG